MTLPSAAPPSPSDFPFADRVALVVEDEATMAELISDALRIRGCEVIVAASGADALRLLSAREPDVVVLDLGLPDVDGVALCRQVRRGFRNPIIVVTADGEDARKVAALDEGADDYVTKPFSMNELLARVRVALRHRAVIASSSDPSTLVVGDVAIDTGAHEVTVAGTLTGFSRKEFDLLAVLARECGRVVTLRALLQAVWRTGDMAKSETLRVHVNQVRRKLGDGPARPRIENVPGVGYRMTGSEPEVGDQR